MPSDAEITPLSAPMIGHPLGPLVSWPALEQPIVGRIYAAGILVAMGAILITAARLHPDAHQYGTHEQLGLPPCGFLIMTGLPCPTCGMTTAFAYTVHGRLGHAAHAQFAGLVMALGCVVAGFCSIIALVGGRTPAINWYRINPVHLVWWTVALLIAGWAVKIVIGLLDGTLPAGQGA